MPFRISSTNSIAKIYILKFEKKQEGLFYHSKQNIKYSDKTDLALYNTLGVKDPTFYEKNKDSI